MNPPRSERYVFTLRSDEGDDHEVVLADHYRDLEADLRQARHLLKTLWDLGIDRTQVKYVRAFLGRMDKKDRE